MDVPIADYTRDGVTRTVRLAGTTPSRAEVLRMRESYYRSTLTRLGVSVWDDHDETAVHLLCVEGTVPVGSLRVTLNRRGLGDMYEDFPQADELLGDSGDFLSFARELVVPGRRGSEVTTAMAHAACLWWRGHSPVRRVVFTSIVRAGRSPAFFGATAVTAPVPLGPAATPVVMCTGWLDPVIAGTTRRLERAGWSVTVRPTT
ncbi:hypothetical protein [Kitasatospora sp. GP82]|uniref:hypothetical protein n=1 Tax=Kitasatospora sp. GP82 TaxID=3035089 RepID=UPI0024762038|nr:hypothetical protein [Kitasatospora sp. GP82]